MLTNGFYRVEFGALLPGAPGIVVLENGQVRGGDGGNYIYSGTFQGNAGSVDVVLKVKPIQAGAQSVFGTVGKDFQLKLSGQVVPDGFVLAGPAPDHGGPQISIRGKKVSEINF